MHYICAFAGIATSVQLTLFIHNANLTQNKFFSV